MFYYYATFLLTYGCALSFMDLAVSFPCIEQFPLNRVLGCWVGGSLPITMVVYMMTNLLHVTR